MPVACMEYGVRIECRDRISSPSRRIRVLWSLWFAHRHHTTLAPPSLALCFSHTKPLTLASTARTPTCLSTPPSRARSRSKLLPHPPRPTARPSKPRAHSNPSLSASSTARSSGTGARWRAGGRRPPPRRSRSGARSGVGGAQPARAASRARVRAARSGASRRARARSTATMCRRRARGAARAAGRRGAGAGAGLA
ncbi:hypothetical protein DENSPDRAFT_164121 [Dentipellis sp. KUC8613]|nr:hypothetical protein DENSPDRAFT_164121 [Dentipellis sp. KUC8613]